MESGEKQTWSTGRTGWGWADTTCSKDTDDERKISVSRKEKRRPGEEEEEDRGLGKMEKKLPDGLLVQVNAG